jgi:hypothetical protein
MLATLAALLLTPSAATPDLLRHELTIRAGADDTALAIDCRLTLVASDAPVELELHERARELVLEDAHGQPLRFRRRGQRLEIDSTTSSAPVTQWRFRYRVSLPRPLASIGLFAGEPLYPTRALPAGPGELPERDPTSARIRFDLPTGLQGIAAGSLQRQSLPDGRQLLTWTLDRPSTLHPFLISPLEEHVSERAGRIYRLYLRPANRARAAEFLEHMAGVVEFLSQRVGDLGIDTFAVAEQSLIRGMKGFSAPGLTVLSSEEIVAEPEFPYRILAHELSHAWWTFAVDPAGLADGVLREGLPTYTGILYSESRLGPAGLRSELDNSRRIALLPRDPEPLSHGFGMRNKNNVYPLNYHKAAYVLHMLRRELGDPGFDVLLRRYFELGQARRPVTRDFQRLAGEIAGRPLTEFFQAWIESSELPRLALEQRWAAGRWIGRLIQTQAEIRARVTVRAHFADGSFADFRLQVTPGSAPFDLDCPRRPIRFELDPDHDLLSQR